MSFDKPRSVYIPGAPANGDEIAAYLRVGAVALTKTTVGGINALDVASLTFDGAGNAIGSTGGALNVAIASIAALVSVQGNVADDAVDSGNPVKIGFKAIGAALTAVSAAGDRVDGISDLFRRQIVSMASNIAVKREVIEVDDTAGGTALDAVAHPGRVKVILQNLSDVHVYFGEANTVTDPAGADPGIVLAARSSVTLTWGEYIKLFAICSTGETADVLVAQEA